jgi:hypothetical protein
MMRIRSIAALGALLAGSPGAVLAYPGGTPDYQTDAAPFCASCHSSLSEGALAGAGERATKELVANKHFPEIQKGEAGYEDLPPADRETLIQHIRAVDEASGVTLEAPASVAAGGSFEVTVKVTGGAGPVVGIALVDAAHRWHARPAASAGWAVAAPPRLAAGASGDLAKWLSKRGEAAGRNLSYVNVSGVQSDAAKKEWAKTAVVFTLRAPAAAGKLPLTAAYFYGTEKASPLGAVKSPLGFFTPRGSFTGHSGRVVFSDVAQIEVK